MKKITLIIACVLYAVSAIQAQEGRTYQPVLSSEGVDWHGGIDYYDTQYDNYLLKMVGDTVVGAVSYKKIECFFISTYIGNEEIPDVGNNLLMREDTILGRLWCRFPNGNEEFLIYDISMSIGDTFRLQQDSMYTDNPTSLYVVTGQTYENSRLTLTLHSSYREIQFIEGIGCTNIFDNVRFWMNLSNHLLCCHKDGELVYHNPIGGAEDCIIPYVGINQATADSLTVFPNPSSGILRVEGTENANMIVYNQRGQVVNRCYGTSEINIQALPSGIYHIMVVLENNTIVRKIIKL